MTAPVTPVARPNATLHRFVSTTYVIPAMGMGYVLLRPDP